MIKKNYDEHHQVTDSHRAVRWPWWSRKYRMLMRKVALWRLTSGQIIAFNYQLEPKLPLNCVVLGLSENSQPDNSWQRTPCLTCTDVGNWGSDENCIWQNRMKIAAGSDNWGIAPPPTSDIWNCTLLSADSQIHKQTKYTNTKIHKYTNSQIHKYTSTQIHSTTATTSSIWHLKLAAFSLVRIYCCL